MSQYDSIRSLVRHVIAERSTLDDEAIRGVTYREAAGVAIPVTLVLSAINFLIVGPIATFIYNAISDQIEKGRFAKREKFYEQQRDGTLEITIQNDTDQPVNVTRAYGGFFIERYMSDLPASSSPDVYDPIPDRQKLFGPRKTASGRKSVPASYFMGNREKINLSSVLTGKPHPKSLIMPLTGTIGPKSTGDATGNIATVAAGFDVDAFGAPFMATHVEVRVGDKALVIPVMATRDFTQATAVTERMLGKKKLQARI